MSMDSSLLTPVRATTELADEASALSNVGDDVDGSSIQPLHSPVPNCSRRRVRESNSSTTD